MLNETLMKNELLINHVRMACTMCRNVGNIEHCYTTRVLDGDCNRFN